MICAATKLQIRHRICGEIYKLSATFISKWKILAARWQLFSLSITVRAKSANPENKVAMDQNPRLYESAIGTSLVSTQVEEA